MESNKKFQTYSPYEIIKSEAVYKEDFELPVLNKALGHTGVWIGRI